MGDIVRMSIRHSEWDVACKVYIGGLSEDANRYDLEDAFTKFGPVKNVWVARRPPGFAFVEMEDPRDAEDAVRGLDGTRIAGNRVKVEMSTGKSRDRRDGDDRRGGDRRDNRGRDDRRGGGDRDRGGREVGQGVVVGGDEALPTGACQGAKTGPSQGPDPSCWVFVQYWYYNDDAHESNLVILRVHFVSTDYFISKKIVISHQASFEWVCKLSSVIQWSMLAYGKFAHIIRSRIAFRYECS